MFLSATGRSYLLGWENEWWYSEMTISFLTLSWRREVEGTVVGQCLFVHLQLSRSVARL